MAAGESPENLTYEAALGLLFPHLEPAERPRVALPKGWTVWRRPTGKAALPPLDELIKTLFVVKREELEGRGVVCAYYAARVQIALAAGMAHDATDFKERGRAHVARLRRLNKELDAIERFFFGPKNPARFQIADLAPLDEPGVLRRNDRAIDIALTRAEQARAQLHEAMSTLRDLAKVEMQRRLVPGNNVTKALLWQEVFVQHLGIAWRGWTGSDPPNAHTGDFADFIEMAYVTLGGGALPSSVIVKAISQIKGKGGRAPVAAAPDGQGFDRYDHIVPQPPPTAAEIAAEHKRRQEAMHRRILGDIRSWAAMAVSDDASQRTFGRHMLERELRVYIAQANSGVPQLRAGGRAVLDYVYKHADEFLRDFIERQGFEPPKSK